MKRLYVLLIVILIGGSAYTQDKTLTTEWRPYLLMFEFNAYESELVFDEHGALSSGYINFAFSSGASIKLSSSQSNATYGNISLRLAENILFGVLSTSFTLETKVLFLLKSDTMLGVSLPLLNISVIDTGSSTVSNSYNILQKPEIDFLFGTYGRYNNQKSLIYSYILTGIKKETYNVLVKTGLAFGFTL